MSKVTKAVCTRGLGLESTSAGYRLHYYELASDGTVLQHEMLTPAPESRAVIIEQWKIETVRRVLV